MRASRVDLLTNASSTGSAVLWPGGRGTFLAAGTFGGATVSLQVLGPDESSWIDAGSYTTFTANGVGNFDLPQGKIRASVASGTPSSLYAIACTIDL